ncbi:MAG: polyphenol oxidase family protein [Candidatus Saccharimonadales bacterium]
MIAADQPTIFPMDIVVRVSSAGDGTMLDRTKGVHTPEAVANRRRFCETVGVDYKDVVYQQIIYDEKQTYKDLKFVDKTSTSRITSEVHADSLITAQTGVGIMLPIADCVATVVYDPGTRQLAVLHLGRHSTVTSLLPDTIKRMIEHGSNIEDILVWMCPSAQQKSYVLEYFDQADHDDWKPFCTQKSDGVHVDLVGYNRQVCLDAGIPAKNIEVSPIDTFTSNDYFSHSRGDTTKRFVVLAIMH